MTGSRPSNADIPKPEQEAACCIQQAALRASTLPILVFDENQVLCANPAMNRVFGAATGAGLTGLPLRPLISKDILHSARERMRLMIENGAVFDDLLIKAVALDGSPIVAKAWLGGAQYHGGKLMLMLMSSAGSYSFLDSQVLHGHRPPGPNRQAEDCIHSAVFDALPVPLVIYDATNVVKLNPRASHFLGSDNGLEGEPVTRFRHEHVADAAHQRVDYVMGRKNPAHGISGKYVNTNGESIRATGDAVPFDYDDKTYAVYTAKSVTL